MAEIRLAAASGECNQADLSFAAAHARPWPAPTTLPTREANLIARIAEDFPLACPGCDGDIRLIAFITDPATMRKILLHLGEPLEPPPLAPARGPPNGWAEILQVHDDRDAMQTSPDDLPVIDIRSLSTFRPTVGFEVGLRAG